MISKVTRGTRKKPESSFAGFEPTTTFRSLVRGSLAMIRDFDGDSEILGKDPSARFRTRTLQLLVPMHYH